MTEADGESPQAGHRIYVRPGERKTGSGILWLAGILGGLALAAVATAVFMSFKKNQPPQPPKANETTEKKEGAAATTPEPVAATIAPPTDKKTDAKSPAVKNETPGPAKPVPEVARPAAPAVMLSLPRGRPFALRSLADKPELIQVPSGTPVTVDVSFDKVKRFFAPDNRVAHDVVVVWQVAAGSGGTGERIGVDTYSGSTGLRVGRFEFDSDGKDLKCDLAPNGTSFAAVTTGNKITIWDLTTRKTLLEGFDPYAAKPEHGKSGLAAIFYTANSTQLVTVSATGAIDLFEIATRKPLAEVVLPGGEKSRVAMGKSVAADATRSSVVVALRDTIYQIDITNGLSIAWKLELGGAVGRPHGLAAVGSPGRIAFAFETDADKKQEKAVLFCRPNQQPVVHRWADAAGTPTAIQWAGGSLAIVPTTRGALWVDTEGMSFTPLALVEVPGGKCLHDATETAHWYLVPSSADPAKSVLLELTLPPANLIDYRNAAEAKQPLFTLRLDEKGLWK